MIIIVKCEEELNEGVIDKLPSWCSLVRVFLKTKTEEKSKSIKFEKSLGKLKRLTSICKLKIKHSKTKYETRGDNNRSFDV